jgi:hypothetical protein
MAPDIPPGQAAANLSPVEREARWDLTVRFAIQATGEEEARTILSHALAALRKDLRLRDAPVIRPRYSQIRDDIWIAVLEPDLTHLLEIEPDTAPTRCSFVMDHFPISVEWVAPQNTQHEAKREWPPDIGRRTPGTDDLLPHPAVRAVTILCQESRQD